MQMAGDADGVDELTGIPEFLGVAKGPTTADALNSIRAKTPKPRYCLPTDPPVQPAGTNARFYVLGPPHDEKMLRKINPSASHMETYGLALDSFPLFMEGAGTALGNVDSARPRRNAAAPCSDDSGRPVNGGQQTLGKNTSRRARRRTERTREGRGPPCRQAKARDAGKRYRVDVQQWRASFFFSYRYLGH
jgi:hypothetical protein